jgi:hypothetical protein
MKELKRQTLESTSRSRKPEAENDNCELEKSTFKINEQLDAIITRIEVVCIVA